MLEDMDAGVGRITKALDKKGLAKNTLFVFASDHGAILPGSNAPFRGFKSGLFEGGIRTACILRWPGHLAAGSVSDQPTITMDLTRSFIKAAEKSTAARNPTVKQSHDGIDIVSHLAEKKPALSRAMFWRAKRGDRVWRAARDGSWKYVTRRENGKFEEWVFDLSKDPAEQNNLLKAERKQAKRLATMLSIWEAATQHSR
jgi:N-acetylgalactosamine-6-sulfatase